jgi:hypothetical protein
MAGIIAGMVIFSRVAVGKLSSESRSSAVEKEFADPANNALPACRFLPYLLFVWLAFHLHAGHANRASRQTNKLLLQIQHWFLLAASMKNPADPSHQ